MRKFFALTDETIDALGYINGSNGKTDPAYMKEHFPNFLRTAAHSTDAVLRALRLPRRAQDILSTYWSYIGVDTKRLAFMHYAAMVHKYVNRSAYIPALTSHGLSLALVDRFLKLGGEVWYNTKAEKVLFDGDAVCGVSTTQGDVATRHVILNCSPHTAYATMIPKERVPERELKLANARTHSARAFVLYLGLNQTAEELGIRDYSYFRRRAWIRPGHTSRSVPSRPRLFDRLCYNVVNPNASPEGTCMMSFTTFYTEDVWKDIPPELYFQTKNKVAKRMIEQFRARNRHSNSSSDRGDRRRDALDVRAIHQYAAGTMYGYETNEWDSMMARLMSISDAYPIKGLKFAGAHGPRGDGYSSTYLCGELIARLTLKDMAEEGE
jgi:prolycopene isomerase